jgi:hypothetical protein
MTKIWKTDPKCWGEKEQEDFSFIAGGNVKWYSHFGMLFDSIL